MANKVTPQGAQPFGTPLRVSRAQAGGTIYPGDFVKRDSNGQVVVAAATNALAGVAVSYATSGNDVLVLDDPSQLFIVEASAAEIAAQTNLNLNYDIVATSGDATYKVSRHELDSSTGATTATLPLKVLEIVKAPDNAFGARVKCVVKINNHQLAGGTGTAGT